MLTIIDGLLLRGKRIVVPDKLRADVLTCLHDGHLGVTKCTDMARESVWWPGITRDIENMVRDCHECEKHHRARVEPMTVRDYPDRPWQIVGCDFMMHKNNTYLVVVDYYSRDLEIMLMTKKVSAAETIVKMKKVFSRQGIAEVVFSDNGPQFSSDEFATFASAWNFEHVTSSPRYPQANGEAERTVQTMKALLKKCDDEYLALLNYRATPLQNGFSPAQLSMGRNLRTRVPCVPEKLKPEWPDVNLVRRREAEYRRKMKLNYDRRHRVVQPEVMFPGANVHIPDMRTTGTLVRHHDSPNSVMIETPRGEIRRNRQMIRRSTVPENQYDVNLPVEKYGIPTEVVNQSMPSVERQPADVEVRSPQPVVEKPVVPVRRSTRLRQQPKRLIQEM